jgi:tetratricopeptide (TPR) repeat protein
VKAGQERLLITLSPGDGSKLSEDEVRKGAAARGSSTSGETKELTAEEKKARADLEAKNKEIMAKNEKALKTNEIVARAIKEGNDAFTAKNYDLAIAKYDEGIAADPDFVGSAPTFHSNRSAALTSRGVDTYNKAVKATDVSEKVASLSMAKKDFADAAQGYLLGWKILKNAAATDVTDRNTFEAIKLGILRGAKETFTKAVRTEQVDNAVIEVAKMLIPEYLSVETDAVKKAEASLTFADLYRVIGDSVNAIAAYKKILETSPDNQDALLGAGLSLVNQGYLTNDKAMFQEGANYLQKFASMAPDTNKFKADAVALIDLLKKEQNVTPQKTPSTKKKN